MQMQFIQFYLGRPPGGHVAELPSCAASTEFVCFNVRAFLRSEPPVSLRLHPTGALLSIREAVKPPNFPQGRFRAELD